MTTSAPLKSIIVERDFPLGAAAIWQALTTADLIKDWLMDNDFALTLGQKFNFRAEPMYGWNGVTDCEVLNIRPNEHLSYSWDASGEQAKDGLKTTVSWTLTPADTGTSVRMEQAGFRPQDEGGYQAMGAGWPRIVDKLGEVAGR